MENNNVELIERIFSLKERRKAVILAHNYQLGEVQDIADFVGDSLELSQKSAKTNADISYEDLVHIIKSRIHEDRLCALIILVYKFDKAKTEQEKQRAVDFYIQYHLYGNNWDFVDTVTEKILGPWLINRDKSLLYDYAHSSNLWERRIAIITTFHFIKQGKPEDTIKISEILLNDKDDLIHKAVGTSRFGEFFHDIL